MTQTINVRDLTKHAELSAKFNISGEMTLAALIQATNGEAVLDSDAHYDTPVGRSFAQAVLTLVGQNSPETDLTEAFSRLTEQGRRAIPSAGNSVIERLKVKGGGNSVNFILERLTNISESREGRLAALLAVLGGGKGYRPTVVAPKGITELIVKIGHAEYLLTIGEDGVPTAEAVPYRSPVGGERWEDATGKEYLIVAGGENAITLDGNLFPLTEGALPGTVRGVSFIFKGA